MPSPRVSIVCIFFNEAAFLAEAIESVLVQDFRDFELLLVDDGSSDGSSEIAQRFVRSHPARIRYLEHPGHANRGSSAARNLGLHAAQSEFITWLDGDDRFHPHKLAEQVALLDANPTVGMVCGGYNRWRSWHGGRDERFLAGHRGDGPTFPPETTFKVYPLGWAKNPTETMIRRSIAMDIGGFEEDFPGLYDDQTFYAKAFLATGVLFSDRIWLDYREHPASCTADLSLEYYMRTRRRFFDWFAAYVEARSVPAKSEILRLITSAKKRSTPSIAVRLQRKARRMTLSIMRYLGMEDRFRRDLITN